MARFKRSMQLVVCVALMSASVGWAADYKKETAGQYVDDAVITTKVKAAIFNNTALKTLQISVKTYKGRAQLSGFVDSAESVAEAGAVAAGVEGVASVQNDLIVK